MSYFCDESMCRRVRSTNDEIAAIDKMRYPNENTIHYTRNLTSIETIRMVVGMPALYVDLYKQLPDDYLSIIDVEALTFCVKHDLLTSHGKEYCVHLYADDIVNDHTLCDYMLSGIDSQSSILYDSLSPSGR